MSITSTDNKVSYQGNGATYQWPFTFPVLEETDIKVFLRDPTGAETQLTSDYYVDLITNQVIYPGYKAGTEPPIGEQPSKLPAGWTITIVRKVSYTQEVDLGDRWPFDVIEQMIDKATMQVQQLAEQGSRVLSLPISSDASTELPPPQPGKAIKWDNEGTGIVYTEDPANVLPLAQNLLNQTQQAQATAEAAMGVAVSAKDSAEQAKTLTESARDTTVLTAAQAQTDIANLRQNSLSDIEEAKNKALEVIPKSGAIGIKNYIADGLKFGNPDGLNLPILPGRANIEEEIQVLSIAENLALDARMTSLIYLVAQANGVPIVGKKNAEFPAAQPGVTVGRWDMNDIFLDAGDGKAKIRDTSGSNNHLVINGTISEVDGWIGKARQGNGIDGYMISAVTTGFPVGAGEREIDVLFTPLRNNANQYICHYGDNSGSALFGIKQNGLKLEVVHNGSNSNTGFELEIGKTYLFALQYDGAKIIISVNGTLIFTYTVTLVTNNTFLNILRCSNSGGIYYNTGIVHYVEIRNKMRTPQQLAQIANKLILPCRYIGNDAQYPTIKDIDKSTYHEWRFDETSGIGVTDSNTTSPLNGTATGTTIVDSEIGLGKARKANGSGDRIDIGSKLTGTGDFTIISLFKVDNHKSDNILFSNGGYGTTLNAGVAFMCGSDGTFKFCEKFTLSDVSEGYTSPANAVPLGKTNFLAITSPSAIGSLTNIYLNNVNPYTTFIKTRTRVTPSLNMSFLCETGYNGNSTLDYFLFVPRVLSQAEITQIYNSLMAQKEKTIVDDILPANSISLGFARTDGSKVIEYDDSSYKYGRREKAVGGNRKVFLGWKYFSGLTTLSWDSPFDTNKISAVYTFAQDLNGLNETEVDSLYRDNTSYQGLQRTPTISKKLTVTTMPSGVVYLNNVWQTSGYIGCYAEVIE